MPKRSGTLGNWKVELAIKPPWWSWLWGGLVYQPLHATVSVFEEVKKEKRRWYCLWFCKTTVTVRESRRARINIHALGVPSDIVPGSPPTDLGNKSCENCSSKTFVVHQIGFPVPPWAGGGGWKGVGFRSNIAGNNNTLALQCHWGNSDFLPADHVCPDTLV